MASASRSILAHGFEAANAPLIARSSCFDALTDPRFLLSEFFIEQCVRRGLRSQLLCSMLQKVPVATFPQRQQASIQLSDPIGDRLKESPVVGDQHDGPTESLKLLLQPDDGRDVQVVCRLIQE